MAELWPSWEDLLDFQLLQFLKREITDPPVVFFLLGLIVLVTTHSPPVLEFLDLCDVSDVAEVPIMENDNLVVLGQQDVELNEIAFEDGSLYAL